MAFIYENLACRNYCVAIILFTIFVRILLLPLNVKQQNSLERQQALMPELDAIKRKYKDDSKKMQEEQMNLYTKYNINPYGGCLPALIQFPLILALYQIIRRPLTYIAGFSTALIKEMGPIAGITKSITDNEIKINKYFLSHLAELPEGASAGSLVNMKFLKVFDLGEVPKWKIWESGFDWKVYGPLLLIPFLAVGSSYLQMWFSTKMNESGKKKDEKDPTQSSMSMMLKIMPIMTLFFAFALPAGLGFYWTVSNIVGFVQTYLIKRVFTSKKKEGNV